MKTKGSLYGLSLITGLIGTVLTVELEVSDSKENSSSVAHRALYAFILFIAGVLFDAARIAAQSKTQSPPSDKAVTPPHSPSSPPSMREESPPAIPDKKSSADSPLSESGTGIALLELKSTPAIKEEKTEATSPADDDDKHKENKYQEILAEEITSLSSHSLSGSALSPVPATGWRGRLSYCLDIARDLVPTVWFAQSLTLFLQNALEESATSQLLPYTALAGLTTGYLFRTSIKPWQLFGIRYWIENHRNELVVPELIIRFILSLDKSYFLFTATTASYWTGYNLEELTNLITAKLLKRTYSNNKNTSHEELDIEQFVLPRFSTALFTSLTGIVLSSISFLIVRQPNVSVDQTNVKNQASLWMAAIGNYALAYPLGIYLGRYLPRRYHEKALIAATYLLVPFANPDLTIPHYLLIVGAGLCGGVAHFISKTQYQHQLAKTQRRKQLINDLLQINPSFLYLLPHLSLPNDLLLQQYQRKKRKMTLMVKICFIISALYALSLSFSAFINKQPIVGSSVLISSLGTVCMYIGGFYILPHYIPSIYISVPLSTLKQFFYRDSFTLIFLLKISIILSLRASVGNNLTLQPYFYLFSNIMSLIIPAIGIKAFFKREHGYQPYIPRAKDIKQLAATLKLEALDQRLKTGNARLSCSYHLLKFMQENPPVLPRVLSLSSSESRPLSAENKISADVLLINQEDKLSSSQLMPATAASSSPTTASSSSWSSQSLWKPLPRNNQPQVVEGKLSIPVAILCEENSTEAKLTLEANFDGPYDQSYTKQRLNIDFELRALDAAVRGPSVAGQFAFGLPKGLSLSPDVTSFRF